MARQMTERQKKKMLQSRKREQRLLRLSMRQEKHTTDPRVSNVDSVGYMSRKGRREGFAQKKKLGFRS